MCSPPPERVRQTVSDGRAAGRPGAAQEPMQLGVPTEPVGTAGVMENRVLDVERVHVDLLSFSYVVRSDVEHSMEM
jgi:hypothetical protein